MALGYTHVRRYQLGMSVWRALSHTVQTDLAGFDYIYKGDHTAVFVDARTPAEYASGTVTGAVNVQKGEAAAANDDGRLPLTDKGTRIVVFGRTDDQSKAVATEIAQRAYLEQQLLRRRVRRSGRRPLRQIDSAAATVIPRH